MLRPHYGKLPIVMNLFARFRRNQRLIRSVFAVLVFAWLQAMLLPCAMASATEQLQVNHQHCVYCPTTDQSHPDGVMAAHGCVYPHAPQADSRNTQQNLEQVVFHAAFINVASYELPLTSNAASQPIYYSRTRLASRPLTLTYCKQLK